MDNNPEVAGNLGKNKDRTSDKKIIHQLINFAVKHRKIMQNHLDETGIYHAQHRLLMVISYNPNASQNDLARIMDVSAATIAVSLKKLEREGYIYKEQDESDNRYNKITITEKGNRVVERSREIFKSTEQKIFEGFTEEEKSTLSVLLQKLDANLVRMEEEIKLKKEKE